jgi:ribonucleotide monophosphatase NagD (HAD superfamily)
VWVAANTDLTLPSVRGPLPGNGAFVAVFAWSPVSSRSSPASRPGAAPGVGRACRRRRPLVVGDRLDTDVLGAVRVAPTACWC